MNLYDQLCLAEKFINYKTLQTLPRLVSSSSTLWYCDYEATTIGYNLSPNSISQHLTTIAPILKQLYNFKLTTTNVVPFLYFHELQHFLDRKRLKTNKSLMPETIYRAISTSDRPEYYYRLYKYEKRADKFALKMLRKFKRG